MKGRRAFAHAFACIVLLLPLACQAAFFMTGQGRALLPRSAVAYRVDDGSGFEQVFADQARWVSQSDTPFVVTPGAIRVWARVDLPIVERPQRPYVGIGPWEDIEYFVVRDGRLVEHKLLGTLRPLSERPDHVTSTPLFLYGGLVGIDLLPKSRTTIYARLATEQRLLAVSGLTFTLRSEESVLAGERKDRILAGIFYGVVLVILLYNLGVYFAIREPSYLYFVGMQAGLAAAWATFLGLSIEFLWPAHPGWDLYFLWMSLFVAAVCLAQFLRLYLDTPRYFPRIDVAVKWYAYLNLLGLPLVFILPAPVGAYFDLFNYAGPIWTVLMLALLIFTFVRRHPLALNLLIAIGAVGIGMLTTGLAQLGALPANDWTLNAGEIGSALSGIVFSIGLGFRMRALREEFTRGLEAKVVERTAQLVETQKQLETANRHKSDFLAHMSHELRTPLNSIIGFSEVLREKMFGPLNEKQDDYLKDIHDSGRHLLALINDILDLSKIEAGKMELQRSTFDLPTAIGNAVTLVRERALRHGVTLATEIDPKVAAIDADERKVKQILLNLLSNAVKFTPEGGRVDVSAKLEADRVEVAVRDTGAGISTQDQASLFKEFQQVGNDSARKGEGTGLGLALTKKFVELHGGNIRVESVLGKGSLFAFTLPVRPAAA
ncbi:MAG: hypothetical protein JOZ85_02205 [Betaproteobacteria bacterium]|nr:hypothetical protein [Betaproteobacteria bacterium]